MEKEVRQFEILKALASNKSVAGQELSNLLEVSLRTIYRDIEELLQNGITIEGTRGADGGYRLHDQIGQIINNSNSLGDILEAVGDNNTASELPRSAGFENLPASKVYVDSSFLMPSGFEGKVFETVCECLGSNHAAQIATFSGSPDVVMPLGLVFQAGTWVLISSDLSERISTFPLSSVRSASKTALTFKPPKSFRSADFVLSVDDGSEKFEVEFVVDGETGSGSNDDTLKIGPLSTELAVRWLASRGPGVSVISPKHVRKALREYACKIADANE
ncbi:MAG: HTH domain-containing protein [Verrucomicrobiota bacterium]